MQDAAWFKDVLVEQRFGPALSMLDERVAQTRARVKQSPAIVTPVAGAVLPSAVPEDPPADRLAAITIQEHETPSTPPPLPSADAPPLEATLSREDADMDSGEESPTEAEPDPDIRAALREAMAIRAEMRRIGELD